jgi:precorrin-6Y C5,15-methyltransferase (decarboxylating)
VRQAVADAGVTVQPDHLIREVALFAERSDVAEEVARLADRGRRVAVLASGDPLFFGIGPWLTRRLGRERVRVYPGIGSVQLAFARLGESWHDATVLSAHGRPLRPVVERALASSKLAVLLDQEHTAAVVARAFIDAGMEPHAAAWVMQRLGGPAERVVSGALGDVLDTECDPLSVLVVLRDPARVRGPAPRLGLPDTMYARARGQITKAEVRAVSLARLAPRAGDTVWDVGAGSGSVTIEAAGLCRPGTVYAVERRPEQQACVVENVRRFGVANARLVEGEAPETLSSLPDPDAVFVGGSGGRLTAILGACLERLRPGGRLVANLATLEALHEATRCLAERGLSGELAQVSVARGTTVAGRTRLAALNPVFVLSTRVAE